MFRQHPNASVAGIWSISSLKGKVLVPGGRRSGQFFEIFELLGGAGDIYITRQICPTTSTLVFRSRLVGTHRHTNASVAGIWPISSLKGM